MLHVVWERVLRFASDGVCFCCDTVRSCLVQWRVHQCQVEARLPGSIRD